MSWCTAVNTQQVLSFCITNKHCARSCLHNFMLQRRDIEATTDNSSNPRSDNAGKRGSATATSHPVKHMKYSVPCGPHRWRRRWGCRCPSPGRYAPPRCRCPGRRCRWQRCRPHDLLLRRQTAASSWQGRPAPHAAGCQHWPWSTGVGRVAGEGCCCLCGLQVQDDWIRHRADKLILT